MHLDHKDILLLDVPAIDKLLATKFRDTSYTSHVNCYAAAIGVSPTQIDAIAGKIDEVKDKHPGAIDDIDRELLRRSMLEPGVLGGARNFLDSLYKLQHVTKTFGKILSDNEEMSFRLMADGLRPVQVGENLASHERLISMVYGGSSPATNWHFMFEAGGHVFEKPGKGALTIRDRNGVVLSSLNSKDPFNEHTYGQFAVDPSKTQIDPTMKSQPLVQEVCKHLMGDLLSKIVKNITGFAADSNITLSDKDRSFLQRTLLEFSDRHEIAFVVPEFALDFAQTRIYRTSDGGYSNLSVYGASSHERARAISDVESLNTPMIDLMQQSSDAAARVVPTQIYAAGIGKHGLHAGEGIDPFYRLSPSANILYQETQARIKRFGSEGVIYVDPELAARAVEPHISDPHCINDSPDVELQRQIAHQMDAIKRQQLLEKEYRRPHATSVLADTPEPIPGTTATAVGVVKTRRSRPPMKDIVPPTEAPIKNPKVPISVVKLIEKPSPSIEQRMRANFAPAGM